MHDGNQLPSAARGVAHPYLPGKWWQHLDGPGAAPSNDTMTTHAGGTGTSSPPQGAREPRDQVPLVGAVGEEAVQVEAAESELRRLGLEEIRVRHHGELARLEAPHRDLASMASEPLRGEVLRAVRSAGFRAVAIDLDATTDPHD